MKATKLLAYKDYIIATNLRRFSKESFYRWGDKNALPNKIVYANYFGGSSHLDNLAEDMSLSSGIEITPEDIVQFVYTYLRNPRPVDIDYGQNLSEDSQSYHIDL